MIKSRTVMEWGMELMVLMVGMIDGDELGGNNYDDGCRVDSDGAGAGGGGGDGESSDDEVMGTGMLMTIDSIISYPCAGWLLPALRNP